MLILYCKLKKENHFSPTTIKKETAHRFWILIIMRAILKSTSVLIQCEEEWGYWAVFEAVNKQLSGARVKIELCLISL